MSKWCPIEWNMPPLETPCGRLLDFSSPLFNWSVVINGYSRTYI